MRQRSTVIFVCAVLLSVTACRRELRNSRPEPARLAIFSDAARESELQPGGAQTEPNVVNPFDGNAAAISEGQRLFSWYNCTGCHANGGGAIGPPLIKKNWIYGGESANLFDTIVKGRPNGMPAWGGKIPEYQVWKLVAYVRSLNKEEPSAATPQRSDIIEPNSGTVLDKHMRISK
jgi:cytochrome c oxidase cbb3-type subunit III